MQHLDEGTIHAWLDGALDADESARAERHVAECAACSAAVAEARGLIAASARIVSSLDIVRGGVIPKSSLPSRRTMWTRLHLTPGRAALAASLLVAAASILTVRHGDKVTVPPSVALSRDAITAAPAAERPTPDVTARTAAPAPTIANQAKPDAQPRPSAPKREATSEIAKQLAGARNVPSDSAAAPRTAAADAKVAAAAPPPPNRADDKAAPVSASAAAPQVARSRPVDSLARRSTALRLNASSPVLSEVTVTSASSAAGAGAARGNVMADAASRSGPTCYRVPPDSLSRLMKDLFFPSRFALDPARDARGQQVVRSVTADGRVDSVLTNFRWERGELNTVNVRWARSAPLDAAPAFARSRGELSMTIRTTDSLVVGEMPGAGQDGVVRLTRIDCRP